MAIQRVAVIFDDAARPETTGVYCRSALQELVNVTHFRPSEIANIPAGPVTDHHRKFTPRHQVARSSRTATPSDAGLPAHLGMRTPPWP